MTAPQRMFLEYLAKRPEGIGTAHHGGVTTTTVRACERRGWTEFIGPSLAYGRRHHITNAGREALREVTG